MRSLLVALLVLSGASSIVAQQRIKANALPADEVSRGWLLLFDGTTDFGWRSSGGLSIDNGALVLQKGAIAWPTTHFGSYELHFEYSGAGVVKAAAAGAFRSKDQAAEQHLELQAPAEKWAQAKVIVEVAADGQAKPKAAADAKLWRAAQPVQLWFVGQTQLKLRNIKVRPLGLQSIFNGKDLTGWKVHPGKKSEFTVAGGELNIKDGPGDLQTEGRWADFVLQLECKSNGKHLNSGVFFRCIPDLYQQGYEAQIRNQFTPGKLQEYTVDEYDPVTHKLVGKRKVTSPAVDFGTGAIYRRVPARFGVAEDGEWFTLTVVAQGRHLATWVNGIQQVDWTDNRAASDNGRNGYRAEPGPISLQGHDPTTDLSFRNFRIAETR